MNLLCKTVGSIQRTSQNTIQFNQINLVHLIQEFSPKKILKDSFKKRKDL